MSNLIPLSSTPLTMSSREIAELVEKRHHHVVRDVRVMLEQIYKDEPDLVHEEIQGVTTERDARGYVSVYRLDKTHTYTLIAGYRADLRFKIIQRWQALEQAAALGSFNIPKTSSEALRLSADLQEQNEKLTAENQKLTHENQVMLPKAEYYDRVADASTCQGMRETAQILGTGRKTMFRFLPEEGILSSNNLPKQQYINSGYCKVIQRSWRSPKTGETYLASAVSRDLFCNDLLLE